MDASIHVSQKKFAKLVGVSQPAVSKAVRAGRVYDHGRGVDLEHPTNVAYAELQAGKRAGKGLPPSPWTLGEREPPAAAPGQRAAKRARPKPKPKKAPAAPPAKASPRDGGLAKAPSEPPPPDVPEPAAVETTGKQTPGPGAPIGAQPETIERSRVMQKIAVETKQYELDLKRTNAEQAKIKLRAASQSVIAVSTVNLSISRLGAVLEDHLRSFGERNASALVAAVQSGRHEGAIADMLDMEIDRGVSAFKRAAMRELETLQSEPG